MNRFDPQLLLLQTIDQLQDAIRHLDISRERCKKHEGSREDRLIELEALISRFARVVDLLIHKVYRTIDVVEFVEGGSLIDVMNRADKRGLIDSIKEMRFLKDLRNEIAHEYLKERLQLLHQEVFEQASRLVELALRAAEYCKRYELR